MSRSLASLPPETALQEIMDQRILGAGRRGLVVTEDAISFLRTLREERA